MVDVVRGRALGCVRFFAQSSHFINVMFMCSEYVGWGHACLYSFLYDINMCDTFSFEGFLYFIINYDI